ncbi:branched-chain amino acid ABC transporter permease [Arthrobacter sp. AZCC_0090]|uniref:branched-chain amino acid ABC transporter permease n=1 Tax=Arthrobacter sp. AZCC_0090 TaxID=2735881 RepID=UPI00161EE77D|nr:branched-chain amino acid ABC transporter permease [Arthrobacter sp. AZCC_0090]MBB6407164.1 branched-chain amino acid transport system permease protein [Arthrobacter sp. AZCC_0090]
MTSTLTAAPTAGSKAASAHKRRPWVITGFAALAVAYIVIPFLATDPVLYLFGYCAVLAVAALGLTLLTGYAGQISLAQPFFIGIGAYATVFVTVQLGVPFAFDLVFAILVSGLVGAGSGWLAVRLGGLELAIVTLGILVIGQYIFNTWTPVTGGETGVLSSGVEISLGPLNLEKLGTFTEQQSLFWVLWATVAAVAFFCSMLVRRAPGRSWIALRENGRAAEAVGIHVRSTKIAIFALASGIGGLAGGLYAGLQQYLSPLDFGFNTGMLLFAIVILGGINRVAGAIIGAIIVPGVQFYISEQADSLLLAPIITTGVTDSGFFTVGSFSTLIFGVLIVAVLAIEPDGIMGSLSRSRLYRRLTAHRP